MLSVKPSVHGFLQREYHVLEGDQLDAIFQQNVKGQTNLGIVPGTITAAADGTASKRLPYSSVTFTPVFVDASDFGRLRPITVRNNATIHLFIVNDRVSLEYDDRVLLTFTPIHPVIITWLQGFGEYIRDTATVNIIDNDGKIPSCLLQPCPVVSLFQFLFTVLMIDFVYTTSAIREGSAMLDLSVTLVISENQNPINITLSSVTLDTAESMMEDLGAFIDFLIPPGYRASTGIYT